MAASGIFDNGYIKFGYSGDGSFGYGAWQTPGIFYDSTGSSNYPSNADFLTPGSPFEFFAVKVGGTNYVNNNANYSSPQMPTTVDTSGVVTAGGKTYGVIKFVSTAGGLEITQTYTLGASDQVIAIDVSVRNTTASTIYGVKYARGIDPDVDSPLGTSATHNNRGADGIDADDIILGTGPKSGRVIGLYTNSGITHNTAVSPGWSTDPATLLSGSSNNSADSTINLAFDLGDLAAGQTKNFSLAYVFAASAAALAESVAQVPPSNPAPTLDAFFDDPVDTIAEDGTVVLSFEDLLPHAADTNADASPGSIAAFVIKAVASGTLKIGATPETATAWAESSHDALTAGMNLYWTPAANANGELSAFTIAARDAEGGLSAAKPVTVDVTPVNDAPTLSVGNIALPAVAEDAIVNAGRSIESFIAPRFSDVDGDALGGIAIDGNAATPEQGLWRYSTDGGASWHDVGAVDADHALVLPADALVRFEPAANWHGTPGGLAVHAVDDTQASYTDGAVRVTVPTAGDEMPSSVSVASRNIETTVASVNDAPVFDSADPVTGTLSDTTGWDTGDSIGELSGTLSATDVDGDTLSYGVRGGVEVGGSIVRQGTYGRLTVDPVSGDWTYEVTNADALNALADGATAQENFDFIVGDGQGGQSTKALTVTLTGANDTPVLSHAIGAATVGGPGSWSFQIPSNAITDAEGLPLTYAIALLDGDGNPMLDGDGAPIVVGSGHTDLGDGNWVAFDAASRTLTGHSSSTSEQTVQFRVTATDGGGESASDTFTVTVDPTTSGANASADSAPVSTNDRISIDVGTAHVLTLDDFGAYADPQGDPLSVVQIVNLPGSGTVEYLVDGVTWTAIDPGRTIVEADISQGYLRISGATAATSIDFRVSDGVNWSDKTYQLAVDVHEEVGTARFADSTVSTAQAGTWTNVYSSDALSGYAGTVRVVVDVTGGTVRLSSVPGGVTAITQGYDSPTDGTATSIAFEGSQADVNAALQLLQANRGTNPNVTLSINAIKGGAAYNPLNGHYYEAVSAPGISWTDARDQAAARTFNGLTGYLVTITNAQENDFILDKLASNAWIGASDEGSEGTWKWVTGPAGESDQTFYSGTGASGTTEDGWYANWQNDEPNDNNGGGAGEDYAQFFASGVGGGLTPGMWNDLPLEGGGGDYAVNSYIVEYGSAGGALQEQASRTITLSAAEPSISVAGVAAYTENAVPKALNPALVLADADSATLASATVAITGDFQSEDVLALVSNPATMGNISAVYNASTGVLTLTSSGGSATLAQWEAALQAVTFASTSDVPGASRTISWAVNDGTYDSNVGTTTIAITAVNDAPTVTHLVNPDPAIPGAPWTWNTGTVFADPEGTAIVYSATLADGSALPDWLSFDADTHTFSGNPPAGSPYLDIKVVGTDAGGASASTTFTLQLADTDDAATAANNPGTLSISGTPLQGETLTIDQLLDADGFDLSGVAYQWQMSGDSGATWTDIVGATASSFTLVEAQVGQQVRLQVFYNDHGGSLEAPFSTPPVTIANIDDAGAGSISGGLGQGSTLVASFSDADGLAGATPTYQWYRVDGDGEHLISGATYSAYTIGADDGGMSMRVKVTYTDDKSATPTTLVIDKAGVVDLAAIAPVVDDVAGSAQEAGGVANADAGADATGNLLANASDANGDPLTITELRAGGTVGSGAPAALVDGELVIAGNYGTLYVDPTTGAYRYEVDEDNETVQALVSGATTLSESFNYVVSDDDALTDSALLTITVSGQNDAAVVTGIPGTATATEDTASPIGLRSVNIADPDASGAISLRLIVDDGTLRASSTDPGIVITGDDTGALTITAETPFGLSGWLKDNDVFYVSTPHSDGSATVSYELDDGSGFKPLAGTTSITSDATNDAPIVDLNGAADGNDGLAVFRPRGEAVHVAPDIAIASGDDDEDAALLASATVAIADGADDNAFGTLYETLDSTHGAESFYFGDTGHLIVITGRGTDTLTLTGEATRAEYETALKTIVYDNANPNAAAGDRAITISVVDTLGQASNAASFAIDAPNADIAAGQRIFVDVWDADAEAWVKTDTGLLVASVSADHQHFVASAPLTQLAPGAAMYFHGADNVVVATATQAGPLVATTTVQVPWTPVIDMNGGTGETDDRDHAVTYTEGQAGVAIATPDASITDQDGKIESVVVELDNPLDAAAEQLFIPTAVMGYLTARGITVAGDGTHQITLGYNAATHPGGLDATDFQIALRAIQYKNTSDNPDVDTARTVTVTSTDVDGHTGVGATTTINVLGVNDAPSGEDRTLTLAEDTPRALTLADFPFTDAEGDALHALKIVDLPAAGSLTLDGAAVTAGQSISRADIQAGKLVYTPALNGHGEGHAGFTFRLQDDGGTARSGIDLDPTANTITFDVTPVNDAPVMTAGAPVLAAIDENAVANAGQRVGDLLGAGAGRTGVADVDTAPAGESHALGIAVHTTDDGANGGGTWQYSIDAGVSWLDVGTVGEGAALLLGADDYIRFVPDQANGTTASFGYHLWDGAVGAAGGKADASVRGGTTAFSEGSDTATLTVTPVNDVPTIDVGADAIFRPRGGEVAVFGTAFAIADVDMLDAGTPDSLVSASVALSADAPDNLFKTFETLRSTVEGNVFVGAGGNQILITGNGSGANGLTDATVLTFTGAGSREDYEQALATVRYDNTNPNATRGDREITVTVTDASVSTGNAGDGLTGTGTITVQVPWTPVVDMNGGVAAGRDHAVTFTEDSAGVAIAAANASIEDQDGNIKQVTVTLTNPQDGADEGFFIAPDKLLQIAARGITVTFGADDQSVVLSGDRDGTAFQFALRAIQYVNGSDDPDTTQRLVTIATLDQDDNVGVGATTVINLVPVNDAPEGIDSAVTLAEDGSHTFAMADFGHTDAEGDALQAVTITTLPGLGTLTLDGVAVTAGQEITVADVDAGLLVYTPSADANGAPSTAFTFQLRDTDRDATPNTLTLNVTAVNDVPSTARVTVDGSPRMGGTLTALPVIADVDRDAGQIAAATSYQWQVREVPGGAWTDVAGANTSAFTPGAGELNREVRVVVTYADTGAPEGDVVFDSAVDGQPVIVGDANGDIVLVLDTDEPVIIWAPEGDVDVNNTGSGPLTVEGLPDGGTLTVDGEGDTTLSNPKGDVTIGNAGPGTVTVTGLPDEATVTATGGGDVVVDQPAGDVTLTNDGTGLVTVRGPEPGSEIVIGGTGPVAVESDLEAGERVTVNTGGNSNVQLSNLGAGVIDVVGDLTLDGHDALNLTLNGPGIPELTVNGAVSLDNTPLNLQLDPGYDADLGDTVTLLDNDGSDAVTGTFKHLPEGAPVYVSGQLFTISYTGGDGNDVVLTRINDGPTGAVTVSGTARQGQTLTASHTLADTDGLGNVNYRWFADGALLAVGASYVVTQAAVGKAITAVATYTDAEGTVESVSSAPTAPVANVNDAPTGQVLVTGTPSLGQTLVASHTLADADGLGTVSYQWQADGADIAGATGSTLLMGREQVGKAITVVASYVDGQGGAEQVRSAVVADGNGVPAEVESKVPGVGSGSTGDGNGDGVQDKLQPSVVSAALEREGGAPSTFVTLVVDSVDGKVREGSADRLMDFTPVQTPSELPSWAQTPAGQIDFTAAVDGVGVTKNFSLYVDKDLGVNGYWTKNADGVLVNLASEAYGGRIVEEGGKLRLDFQITEGGEFDHGTAGDDIIVNHGAAGHASLSLIGYEVDTPVAPEGVNMWD